MAGRQGPGDPFTPRWSLGLTPLQPLFSCARSPHMWSLAPSHFLALPLLSPLPGALALADPCAPFSPRLSVPPCWEAIWPSQLPRCQHCPSMMGSGALGPGRCAVLWARPGAEARNVTAGSKCRQTPSHMPAHVGHLLGSGAGSWSLAWGQQAGPLGLPRASVSSRAVRAEGRAGAGAWYEAKSHDLPGPWNRGGDHCGLLLCPLVI